MAGSCVSLAVRVHGTLPNAAVAVLVCTVVAAAFGAVVLVLDGGDLRALAARARARLAR